VREAQAADLVVVNHHLLLADLAIKREGFREILPGGGGFRARRGASVAGVGGAVLRDGIGARQLLELARDALAESASVPGALATVQQPMRSLEHACVSCALR